MKRNEFDQFIDHLFSVICLSLSLLWRPSLTPFGETKNKKKKIIMLPALPA